MCGPSERVVHIGWLTRILYGVFPSVAGVWLTRKKSPSAAVVAVTV